MAGEWVGHGIRVNSISPGIMNTRLSGGPSQAGLRKLWLEKSPMVRTLLFEAMVSQGSIVNVEAFWEHKAFCGL